jgi:adenylate cyclase
MPEDEMTMDQGKIAALMEWAAAAGLAGFDDVQLLDGFCTRIVDAGLPLRRSLIGLDRLHPTVEVSNYLWQRGSATTQYQDFKRAATSEEEAQWLSSPFHFMMTNQTRWLHRPIKATPQDSDFAIFNDLRAAGDTDYLAALTPFADRPLRDMDGMYSSWSTDHEGGFSDAHKSALRRLVPSLGLAYKSLSTTQKADTLVATYLGRDAGQRVLAGNIKRGVADKISAVLWLSDLRGFTRIADSIPGDQIVSLLSDYAEALVTAIHAHDGHVLKFMGDGLLAIFQADDMAHACQQAIAAADKASEQVVALNTRRNAQDLPITDFYLGLHLGEVFYGNIGSQDRLDFTVVGPAVNEVSRIESMCRALEQDVILSATFAEAAKHSQDRLVSLGRYALRGVRRPQQLFTLDPDAA